MKKLILLIVAIIFTASASLSYAQYKERQRDNHKFRVLEELNLTDEQQSQIGKMKLDNEKEMIDLKADLEKRELEFKQLRFTGDYTRDQYLSKNEEIISAKNKIELARASHQMDVYELLDDSQKKIWNEKSMKFHKRKDGCKHLMKRQFNNE